MGAIGDDILKSLFALQDLKYKDFQCSLMPTVPCDSVIGVRMPALRRLAAEYAAREDIGEFLSALPHRYYEENNLHGLLVCRCGDFARTEVLLGAFLPYVDNWATCDLLRPKAFEKCPEVLLPLLRRYLAAAETYTVRFGIEMLMTFYLDEGFSPEYLAWVAQVQSEEYYVKMMVAWYFATALAKQYDAALPFLTERRLPLWTHNKTIQKAMESYRITQEQKTYLRQYRTIHG